MEALVIGDTAPRRPRVGKRPAGAEPRPGPPAQPGLRPTPEASLTKTARSSLLRGRPLSGRLSHRPGPAAPPQPPTVPAAGPGSALARAASTASRALRRPRPRPARRSREAVAEAPGWALCPPASRGDTPLQSVRARGRPQPRLPSPWLPRGSSSQSQSQVCKMVALCVSTLAVPGMQMKQWEPRSSISSLII